MPELPEVETMVRDLRAHLRGRVIVGATVRWQRTIAEPSARAFARRIRGHRIVALTRRGKFLIFRLRAHNVPAERYLLVHLRMTGSFRIEPHAAPREKHIRVCLRLDDGREARFRDPRKFGRMWLVDDPARVVGKLGPEPLKISARTFHRLFQARRGRLKPLLLDQTFLAGIGNIYADEALWHARLHPLRRVESLTRAERGRLYRAIRRVLVRAIALGGTSIDVMYTRLDGSSGAGQNSLRAFARTAQPCYRCGAPIRKIVVAQRGTHFCPICQPLGIG